MRVYDGQIRIAPVSLSIGTDQELVDMVRHLLIGVTAATTIAVIGPLSAQVPAPSTPQPLPPATYTAPVQRYPFPGTTPEDAYRAGLIDRSELERFGGPIPPALQGPSVNGDRMPR